jgi:hypothetical protein
MHKFSKKPTKKSKKSKSVRRSWRRLLNWKLWLLIVAIILGAWLLLIIIIGSWYQFKHRHDPVQLGMSFSVDTAKDLGVNWQDNYTGLLKDVGVKHLRLMSYWSDIESSPGKYNFKDLDWQFAQAQKYGADVSLAIGIRQPRWPECHRPDWVGKLSPPAQDNQLYNFLTVVVNRYKNNPALNDYQLENEVANHLFGACSSPQTAFNRARLTKEFNLVKSLDSRHPVDINASNQSGVPMIGPVGDEVGFSIYRKAYVSQSGPLKFYWSFWYIPTLWHSYRAGLVELLHGKPTFVHELQTEPWGPSDTKNLSIAEQSQSMTDKGIVQNVHFAQETGMHRMYLWGGEWWYWRLTKFHDDSLWNTAKQLYHQANQNGKIDYSKINIPPTPKS